MAWRIIDVVEDGRYLHTERDWLVVEENRRQIGRIPLVDVQAVLVHAPQQKCSGTGSCAVLPMHRQ